MGQAGTVNGDGTLGVQDAVDDDVVFALGADGVLGGLEGSELLCCRRVVIDEGELVQGDGVADGKRFVDAWDLDAQVGRLDLLPGEVRGGPAVEQAGAAGFVQPVGPVFRVLGAGGGDRHAFVRRGVGGAHGQLDAVFGFER